MRRQGPRRLARIGLIAVLLLVVDPAGAQRFLPGPLGELPGMRVRVRRPMGFEKDLDAPDDQITIERQKGTEAFRRRYRGWYLTLRHHVGYVDEEAVRKCWTLYLEKEKAGWELTLTPAMRFDGQTGLIALTVPKDRSEKGCVVSGAVLLGGGRLFEARLDVVERVRPQAAFVFVEDFLRSAELALDRSGPLRIFPDHGLTLRLPRGWSIVNAEAPVLFEARHPRGPSHGTITWTRVRPPAPADAVLTSALGGRTTGAPRKVELGEIASALIVVTRDGSIVAATRIGDASYTIEGSGREREAVEAAMVRALREMQPLELEATEARAEALAKALKRTLKGRKTDEAAAIEIIEQLTDLLELPAARAVIKRTLSGGPPRVQEAMARALAARADNLTTPALASAARRLARKDQPVTLAAFYRALGRAARPAAIPTLEAGLRHAHPVCVLAAVEALGAPFGRPHKTFDALLGFWERLEAWAVERPQLKDEAGYPLLVRTLKAHLEDLSGQSFAEPFSAREWYRANRRAVKPR